MKTEDFFSELAKIAKINEYKFEDLRVRIPLGVDEVGRIALSVSESLKEGRGNAFGHTCVTGTGKTDFIRRVILTLAGIYEREKIAFVVLSPKREYSELVRLEGIDLFAPVLNSVEELWQMLSFVRSQVSLRKNEGEKLYGKLFLVLDGLEAFSSGSLEPYMPFFDAVASSNTEVFTGVDFNKSVFARSPEMFIGRGNCLVTVAEPGKAHLAYVSEKLTLSLPKSFAYPEETQFSKAVELVNAL